MRPGAMGRILRRGAIALAVLICICAAPIAYFETSWLSSIDLMRRETQSKAGLALNPTFTVSRARATWTSMSDDPTYLTTLEAILEGLRKAGMPGQ
jgi:hypothetical protein